MIFVRGMAGVMFKQLAYVVSFALACSLASALTLVPMLSSLILKRPKNNPSGEKAWGRKIFMASGRLFTKLEESYKGVLSYALSHRKMVLFCAFLLLFGTLMLFPLIGSEFMPETDEGEVRVTLEMEVGTRLGVLEKAFDVVKDVVRKEVPEIKNTATFIGGSSWRGTGSHTGEMRISLKPEAERSRSSEEIAAALRRKLGAIPGAKVRTRAGQGLFILRMGSTGGEKLELEVRGHDLEAGDFLAQQVKELVEGVAGVTDVIVSRESGSPEELIMVDRQKAADMKLTVSQIGDALQTIISGTEASKYREGGKEYAIRVKLKDAETMDLREVLDLTLTNVDGNPVVLRNVLAVRPRTGPVFIERKDQERVVTVSANIAGRDLGSIVNDVKRGLQSIPVPKDFTVSFGADYEEQQKANRELLMSVILALIMVYMVMASLYESLLDPFVVMFSVPLAAIGVILMLFLTHTTFNVQSFIGCIMLGGIVVNNAILLVDHTNLLRRRGLSLFDAIEEAGRRRLRPILMTAATTMLALVPLALGMGEGGEAQAPLARAVLGGLFSSTVITLVVIPVVYSIFKTRFRGRGGEEK
jgi:HAE1 family hydrophobic/amphiphilic exporter-1